MQKLFHLSFDSDRSRVAAILSLSLSNSPSLSLTHTICLALYVSLFSGVAAVLLQVSVGRGMG